MLSIKDINFLKSKNDELKKQNKDLERERDNLIHKVNELKSQCKTEKIRNRNLMRMYYKLKEKQQ